MKSGNDSKEVKIKMDKSQAVEEIFCMDDNETCRYYNKKTQHCMKKGKCVRKEPILYGVIYTDEERAEMKKAMQSVDMRFKKVKI